MLSSRRCSWIPGPKLACHAKLKSLRDRASKVACNVAVVEQTTISAACISNALRDAPCKEVPVTELQVQGAIPSWLDGDLYRSGPGMYEGMLHYFDGYSMLVHFKLEGGRVHWNQRFLQSTAYQAWRATGQPRFSEVGYHVSFLQSATEVVKGALGMGPGFTDNASVTVIPSTDDASELVAMTETSGSNFRVRRDSLETIARIAYKDAIHGNVTTAHPKKLGDGWSINISHNIPGRIEVFKYRVGGSERALLFDLPVANSHKSSPWIHELAVSENHLVLIEAPIYFNLASFMSMSWTEFVFADWKPEDGTTVSVLALDGSGFKKVFKLPPFFTFHNANTFETVLPGLGKCVCIDAPLGDDPSAIADLLLKNLRDPSSDIHDHVWKRMILPLESDAAPFFEDLIQDHSSYGKYAELPSINPAFDQKEYQFVYSGSTERPSPLINRVTKFDLRNKHVVAHYRQPGGMPLSEPKFVARPGATEEDDGVLLAPFMDRDGKSMLTVLSGKDLTELARCYTPEIFVLGFHSTFVRA